MIAALVRKRIRLTWTGTLVVALIAATLLILLVVLVDYSRTVAKRIDCSNHLRQVGIATISFASTNGEFVPADFERDGQSFYAKLLDGLEITDRLPDGTTNPNAVVKPFVCPGRRRAEDVPGACDFGYVELSGTSAWAAVLSRGKGRENRAGTQSTAMLSHIWISPDRYNVADPRWASSKGHSVPYSKATRAYLDTDPAGAGCMGSPHPNGMPTLFADGHVGVLSYTYPQFQMLWDYSNTTTARKDVP